MIVGYSLIEGVGSALMTTGVHTDHRRLRRREDPGEVPGEDPDVVHRFAAEYTRLRAHGG